MIDGRMKDFRSGDMLSMFDVFKEYAPSTLNRSCTVWQGMSETAV
jgi:hypothetical protein